MLIVILGAVAYLGVRVYRIFERNSANKHTQNEAYLKRKNNPWNISVVDSTNKLLRTGDLVVRRGDDMTSYMLSRLNINDKKYSHCGIVVIESGNPYVYHSIGGEDNPDEKLRKDSASIWFSPANNMEYAAYRYNFSDSIIDKVISSVEILYKEQIMFDMDFDLKTDERLYCSEMVYKSLLRSIGSSLEIKPHKHFGYTYVGVDDLYLNTHARPVCQIRFK